MASEISGATGQLERQRSNKQRIGRSLLVLMHRWAGLFLAVFLFISGFTGAIISWDHELDEWLNPQLFKAQSEGDPVSSLALAERLEAADPRLLVTWLPLAVEQGHNLGLGVGPRLDPATGKAFNLDFNQVALDPVNGEMRGTRMWGGNFPKPGELAPFPLQIALQHAPSRWVRNRDWCLVHGHTGDRMGS